MVELDADKLAALQADWQKIAASPATQFNQNLDLFEKIVIGLKDMGLHTAYDSTYELLAPELDREQFRQKRTEMHLLLALSTYQDARRISDDGFFANTSHRQLKALNQLLRFDLPAYETHVSSTGLSATLNPVLVQEIKDLCALKKSGLLAAEVSRLSIECAKDSFRAAYTMRAEQEAELAKGGVLNYCFVKAALAQAQNALKTFNDEQSGVTPCMIPVEYDGAGYWTKERIPFDRAAVVGLHDDLLLKTCRIELQDALANQAQGVLDTSGPGEGAMALPVQAIVEKLTAQKYNMRVPATFAALGTTRQAFWAAYQQERQAAAADPESAKNLAPEFKPGL